MAQYLLDTNIVSDLVRNPQGVIAAKIKMVGEEFVETSVIVAAELRYGAAKKGSERLTRQVEQILSRMTILPWDVPIDETYGLLRTKLEASGTPIGANDLFIAAQALTLQRCVVTANWKEFSRVPDLRIENWLQK